MKAMQNALNFIIKLHGINCQIRNLSTATNYDVVAAQSNYFRKPMIEEEITGSGRSYVVSNNNLSFKPNRGDRFIVDTDEYYSIAQVVEMRVFGNIIGYRLFLE